MCPQCNVTGFFTEFNIGLFLRFALLITLLCGLEIRFAAAQSGILYSIDSKSASINRVNLDTGELIGSFTPPIFCKPEGSCGLAYTGRSLFMSDSTDPERVIYELSPVDGTIWNSFPSPSPKIDGLAYADGTLYALDFVGDHIFALDPLDGTVIATLEPGVDIVGGMAASGGVLYASRIRPSAIFSVDAETGDVLAEWASPVPLPTGLSAVEDRLYVGDFTVGRVAVLNRNTGVLQGDFTLGLGDVAAVAAGRVEARLPYAIRLDPPQELLREDGLVDVTVKAGIYDEVGQLLHRNNHTQMRIILGGGRVDTTVYTTNDGQVSLNFPLEPGTVLNVRAEVDGLEPTERVLRVVSPVSRTQTEFVWDKTRPGLIEIKAYLYDAGDVLAVDDTNTVSFAVLAGRALLVGALTAKPNAGMARSWLYTDGINTDIVVETRIRTVVGVAAFNTGNMSRLLGREGMALSDNFVAGRDNIPPSAAVGLRAVHVGSGRVEVTWDRVPEDGAKYFVPFGEQTIVRNGIEGYRVMRSDAGGFYTEVAALPAGTNRFVDTVDERGGPYLYQIIVSDKDNWRLAKISPTSSSDIARTVIMVMVGIDAQGQEVRGLFDDDGDVDLDDFFLFSDEFGKDASDTAFDGRFDLNGDGAVGLDDFFLFADNFGKEAVEW